MKSSPVAATLRSLFVVTLLAAATPTLAALSQSQKLVSPDFTTDTPLNVADEQFGKDVAVSGVWMAVGAPNAQNGAGRVHLYERVSGAWALRTVLASPTGQLGAEFGASVDIYENAGIVTVIAGAPAFDGSFANEGRAYVFTDTDASALLNFSVTTTINSVSPEADGRFGHAVALFGDIAAVSEPGDGATDSGLVSIRGRNNGGTNAWGQAVAPKSGNLGNRFGTSLDLHGEYLIVGAPMANNNLGVRTGLAYVYRQDLGGSNAWGVKHTLTPGGPADQDFGQSVGIWDSNIGGADSASRSIVGRPQFDNGGFPNVGGIVIFHDGTVNFTHTHPATAGNLNAQLGYSVAIEGNEALAGRPGQTVTSLPNTGQLDTFSFNGTLWATNTINLTETGAARGHLYGTAVDVSGALAVVGSPGTVGDQLLSLPGARRAGVIETFNKPGATWTKVPGKLYAQFDLPYSVAGQRFGYSMAVTNDWMAIGVQSDGQKGANAGAVYMYRNVAGVWTPHSKLTALYGRAGDGFGTSVALQGSRLIVGAPSFDGFPTTVTDSGAIYLYEFNGSLWVQAVERTSPNPVANGYFGYSADFNGDVIAIGAVGENGNTGRAYAYRDLSTLASPITITLAGVAAGNRAGESVSVYDPAPGTANDEVIAVGVPFQNTNVGAAYVLSGPTFAAVTPLANPAPAILFFGIDVSIFNGRVAVGAPTASAAPSGAAYVFSGVGYATVDTMVPTGSPGQFGYSVALNDTLLLVGSPASNGRAGLGHVFTRSGATWAQTDLLQPADLSATDEYGATVAMANGTFLVSAPIQNGAVADDGSAYIYVLAPEVTVTPTSLSVNETGPTTDSFTVSLNQSPSANVTTQLTFDGNVQVDTGSGFGASPQTVTLTPANAVSGVTVNVRAVDDGIDETSPHAGDITTSVTASSLSLFNGLAVADVSVAITDNDTAGVVISQTGGSNVVSEAGGTDTYTIVLGSQPTATVNVAINFPASDLTLNGDTDGTYDTSFTTANWNTPQTITLAAINDRALEGNHAGTLTHAFTSGDGVYNGITALIDGATSSNTLGVAISDNESGLLEWAPTSASAAEGASNATAVRLDITADPVGGTPTLEGTVSYTLATTLGSAEAGDIGALGGALSFTNVSDLATNAIAIPHTVDTLVEGAEQYSLAITLGSAPLGTAASAVPFTGTITDANSATVSLSGTATVSEAVGGTPLTATLNTAAGNTLENAASVAINLTDGTASYAGGTGDYFFNGPNNTLTVNFPAGAGNGGTQSAPVNIREDVLVEASEAFAASLGAVTGAITTSGPGATVTINDNESAAVSFQTATSSVGEAVTPHSVNALLTITAVGSGTAALTTPLTVAITQTPGTAATPADYTLSTPSVTFAAAAQSAATQPLAIAIVDDAITEANEDFALGFGAVTGSGSASGSHTVTITDNDTPGITVVESAGTTAVAEGGAGDGYTVVLNSQPTADVAINIVFDPAQVSLNGDSDGALSLTFTSGNWNVAQAVNVVAVDDTVVETNPHSTPIVQTVASSDPVYAAINPADVTVSIAENDTQEISFVLAASSVSETAGTHVVNARLNLVSNGTPGGTISAAMSANVFLVLGSAELSDLALTTTQVTFPAGSAHAAVLPINLTLSNDRLLEGDESGTLNFGLVGSLGSVSGTHVLTLTDDEAAVIGFTAPSSATNESAGTYSGAIGRLTISGSGTGPLAAEANVSVAITDTAGSAGTPADYTRTTSNLVFAANAPSPVDLPVSASIANDVLIEDVESFSFGFGAISGAGALNAGGTHVVSIADNDLAQIAFAPANDSIGEGAGSFSKPVVLTLIANGVGTASLQNALLVPVSFTEGTATEPEDFTLATASVTFAAGSLSGAAQNATATLINDLTSEPSESFDLNLGNSFVTANFTLGRSVTAVQIIDDDTPGVTVTQSGGTTAVTEGGATDSYTLVLTSQPTANVTITLNPGSQLSAAPTPLTFTPANWNEAQTVTVTAVDDAIAEGSHSGTITHTAASSDAVYNGFVIASVSATISDNDNAGVTVVESGGTTAATEGGATDTYTVVLTSQPTSDVAVVLGVGAQLSLSPSNLTFTAANWNVAQTVTVTATDDAVVEGPHTAAITHSTSSSDPNYSAIAVAGISVAITDNDSAVVNFAPASVSQTEAASPMAFTVTLSAPVASGVTLNVNSAFGTALAADFTPISGTVSFAASSTTPQTVNVAINNDALDENDETFSLALSNLVATGNVTLGAAAATGTILDDDATPSLTITNQSQPEGNAGTSTMTFTVNLSAVSGRDVSFSRATVDGTATAGSDYVALAPQTLSILAGSTSLTIPVTINGDTVFEGNESFTVALTGVSNATPATLSGTGTIEEDDQQPTTTTITADTPDPTVVGQPYTVSVNVAAQTLSPTGTVTITDGSASCGPVTLTAATSPNSTASCSLTSTSAGAKNLIASYTAATTAFGDSVSVGTPHQVNAAATAISVVGPVRSRINQPTTFTFALSVTAPGAGAPAGTVTLSSGAATCNVTVPTATPSCALSFNTLGPRTITAAFAPSDGNFSASSSSGPGNAQTLVYALSDIAVTKTDAVGTYVPGDLLVYTVTVRNLGPDAAAVIRVRDQVPASVVNVDWTCDASGGVACPAASGSGDLDVTIASFPVGGLLNFTFFGNVSGSPAQIVNTALVDLPVDTTIEDPALGNNSASDTDVIDYLLRNGFEDPQVNAPSGSVRLSATRSVADEANVVLVLDDANGIGARVYARSLDGEVQYALATRSAGVLRLAAWRSYPGAATLHWTARQTPDGWVLETAEIR